MSEPRTPLSDLRVIELGHWMAGPAAAGVLADWGADVIKIEPPGGEPMRTIWSSMGASGDAPNGAFISANRGKRSVELDLRSPAGREVLDRLLASADVLVTNLRPAALRRLDLGPDAVLAEHARLVYCSLTAYGWGGPDEDRAGYDIASFFGRTGIAHEITTQGQPPAPLLQGLGDTYAAITAVAGILAAIHERHQTGRGVFVEASLLRTGMWALAGELGAQAVGGRPRPPYPRENCPTPLYNSYRGADGRWFFLVGVEARRHLPRVLAAIGRPDLAQDDRFGTARAISKNRVEFIAILDAAFAEHPVPYWAERFDEHDVWWGPVQTPAEVIDDPQARASGAWLTIDSMQVGGRAVESVDAPIRYDQVTRTSAARPPAAGEHTAAVLAELGYSADEIAALRRD